MNYRLPPLVLTIGSTGGYHWFIDTMKKVDPDLRRNGCIYLAEHIQPHPWEKDWFKHIGIDLMNSEVEEGMKLEKGKFYLNCNLYQKVDDVDDTLIIGKNNNKEPCFVRASPHKKHKGMSHTILSILEAGYDDKNFLLTVMSGNGTDGSTAFMESVNRVPRIVVQNPETATRGRMPAAMIEIANTKGLPYKILEPQEIGSEINDFLGQQS